MPMPMLVELVNGWGTVPRAKAADRDRPPIAAFAEHHAAGRGSPTRPWSGSPTGSTPSSPPTARPSAPGSSPS